MRFLFALLVLFCFNNLECNLPESNNQFASDLYQQVNTDEDLVFSPFSISSCLSMVYVGAREDTEEAMRNTLRLNLPQEEMASAYQKWQGELLDINDEKLNFSIANGIWVSPSCHPLENYRQSVQEGFGANFRSIDFSASQLAANEINFWVDAQTNHKIKNLLSPSDLSADTRLVLVNAIAFKGNWLSPFEKKLTKDRDFFTRGEEKISVPMMEQISSFLFLEKENFHAMALPFSSEKGGEIVCAIFLPKAGFALSDLENSLDELPEWMSSMQTRRLQVVMPKFTVKKRIPLNTHLQKLGMADAFSSRADLSGINGYRDLSISTVVHECFFSCDENGAEAAAATACAVGVTCCPRYKPPYPFVVNRPFLFALFDLKSQTLLFIGKVHKPSWSENDRAQN